MLVNQTWLLRWRFDFSDHKPSRMGLWSHPGPIANQAWHQNKENLARAHIEGKNLQTKEIKTLVHCDGQRFRNFQWVAAAKNVLVSGGADTELVGLCLWMDEKKVTVYHDGRCQVEDLSEPEKNMHLATYGR